MDRVTFAKRIPGIVRGYYFTHGVSFALFLSNPDQGFISLKLSTTGPLASSPFTPDSLPPLIGTKTDVPHQNGLRLLQTHLHKRRPVKLAFLLSLSYARWRKSISDLFLRDLQILSASVRRPGKGGGFSSVGADWREGTGYFLEAVNK